MSSRIGREPSSNYVLYCELGEHMTTTAAKTVFTPEELESLPNAIDYELVDGNLVERHMGAESSAVGAAILVLLFSHVKSRRAGHVFNSECGYLCFPDAPGKVRKPDVSFIRIGRLPGDRVPKGYISIAPDLTVEVLSPGDLAGEIDEKISEYLNAGIRLIWIVNPKTKSVRIQRPATAKPGPTSLSESDTITGEDVLPGFECRVSEFFDI
jgi:Uma2 family endonuclease